MKSMKRVVMFAFLCGVVCLMMTANAQAKTKKITSLKIEEAKKEGLILGVGEKKTLHKVVKPKKVNKKKIFWKTKNKKIVTVSKDGKIKAIKPGTTTIIVYAKDGSKKKASIKVKVIKKVEKIKISNASKVKEIEDKTKIKIQAVVFPTSASNKALTWKSSNKDVASVNSVGEVRAKKKGKTKITATAKYGKKVRGKNVSVSVEVKVKVPVSKITITKANNAAHRMKAGGSYTLGVEVSPKGASNSKLRYVSNDSSVATISSEGRINCKKGSGEKPWAKKVTFSAFATDGSGKKASVTCTVNYLPQNGVVNGKPYEFVGHRGYFAQYPENTLKSLQAACMRIVPGTETLRPFSQVEFDVYTTRDERYVVAHDNTFESSYCGDINGDGKEDKLITNSTFDEVTGHKIIKRKDKGVISISKFYQENDFMIPSLEKYLDDLAQYSGVTGGLELKQKGFTKEQIRGIVELVKEKGLANRISYSSVYKKNLDYLVEVLKEEGLRSDDRSKDKTIIEYIFDPENPEFKGGSADDTMNYCIDNHFLMGCDKHYITKERVKKLHDADCLISSWVVNSFYEAYDMAVEYDVDYICTNGWTNAAHTDVPWNE